MKVMVFVKAVLENEAGERLTEENRHDRAAMDQYNAELTRAGIRMAVGGLEPLNKSTRINFNGTKISVTDGPFAETKEAVIGFWIWQVRSMEEAIEWARRCPNPTGTVAVLELRPIND